MPYIGQKPADIISTAVDTVTGTFSGDIDASTVNATGDTAAGDNAAIGFTSAEGLILTGQGSTNDVTIKNDADADVIEIPTGTVNVTMAGTLGVVGAVTANAGVVVDNITIDGTEIDLSSGDLTVDVAGDITLDAGGGDILFEKAGTTFLKFTESSGDVIINQNVSDKDIKFNGNDGGSGITALTLDMSAGGNATFNGSIFSGGNVVVPNGNGIDFSATADGSGMSNELLADYEEGKFTATCANSVTLHSASSSMVYTKIGRQVHVSGSLRINNSNGGSAFTINNLPFTSSSDSAGYYTSTTLRFYSWNLPLDQSGTTNSTVSYLGRLDPNSTTINFMQVRDNAATIVLPASDNAYIIFGMTYFAA